MSPVATDASLMRPDASPSLVPLTPERLSSALVDNLGGYDAGWAMFRAGLAALELAIERARERELAFKSHPTGVYHRLLEDVADGLRLGAAAAEVEELRHEDGQAERNGPIRRASLERVLRERAVDSAAERRRLVG